jgi:hypothetical protein
MMDSFFIEQPDADESEGRGRSYAESFKNDENRQAYQTQVECFLAHIENPEGKTDHRSCVQEEKTHRARRVSPKDAC